MWRHPTLCNPLANGFEHQKLELVRICKSRLKNLKLVEEGVHLGNEIKYFLLPNLVL